MDSTHRNLGVHFSKAATQFGGTFSDAILKNIYKTAVEHLYCRFINRKTPPNECEPQCRHGVK
jgi:hypothetical protein